jgi:hypothetical protein
MNPRFAGHSVFMNFSDEGIKKNDLEINSRNMRTKQDR